jgi:superfamily I DNA and/or RNA helicase
VLPIQGPPGTGKTHTAAEVIVSLAAEGKRIGVTAVSHKVIRNLLAKVVETAARHRHDVDVVHKVKEAGTAPGDAVREVTSNDAALASVQNGAVVGGTAWLWSRDDAAERLDYLFVDEAGQVSLVQALAASRSAQNVVLIGDPQQLEQPQHGSHPEGADVAALQHLIGEGDTVADDCGLFLNETRRLHPNICAFTSETYYEDRLTSQPGLERQHLEGADPFDGAGLFYIPVQHADNQNKSAEEVEAVRRVVRHLLRDRSRWTNAEGTSRLLTADDVLIVAPYNAQVGLLEEALPQCRVGTVDKFQGQEAPIVVYSMTSSSALEAPRGMSFLYNPNRLNVATSRARCACILVACPDVLEPECQSPRQIKWASGLCRYRELALEIGLDDLDRLPAG